MSKFIVSPDIDDLLISTSNAEFKTKLGAITDAERTKLAAITGTNTGDQDLSNLQVKPTEGAFVDGDKAKLDGIAAGAEVNTIDSTVTGEPSGSDQVLNVVSLTQAEYDAGTPVATTFYIITG